MGYNPDYVYDIIGDYLTINSKDYNIFRVSFEYNIFIQGDVDKLYDGINHKYIFIRTGDDYRLGIYTPTERNGLKREWDILKVRNIFVVKNINNKYFV